MAKQNGNGNHLSNLATAVASAFADVETSGGLVENICKAVQNLYKGKAMADSDIAFVCDETARLRGWNDSSARVRKAETKAILLQYAKLPEAIEKARKKKHVSFDAAVKLARALNKGMTPNQAAAAYIEGNKANKVSPADRDLDTAKKSVTTHVKRILEHTQLDRKFRAELRTLCEEHGIAV